MRFKSDYFEEEELGRVYDAKMLKRLWPFVRTYRLLLAAATLLVILITLTELSIPYISKVAIDSFIVPDVENSKQETGNSKIRYLKTGITDPEAEAIVRKYSELFTVKENYAIIPFGELSKLEKKDIAVLRKDDIRGVGMAALVFVFAVTLNFILKFIQIMIMEYAGQKAMYDLRVHLFSHIRSLSVSFFTRNPVGRLVTRVTNDIQNMQDIFASMIVFIFRDLFLIMGVAVVLLCMNWHLAMVSFAVIPLVLCSSLYFSRLARGMFRVMKIKTAEINTRFSETVGGIKIIQMFSQELKNFHEFKILNREQYMAGTGFVLILARFMRFMGFLDVFVIALMIFYGGAKVLDGSISLGELVAFLAYMRMFFGPIQDIAQKYNTMQNAMASAERIFLILDSREQLPVSSDLLSVSPYQNGITDIRMEDVCFSYVENEEVLKGIFFEIRAGETFAIVGPTGSGKTSLINLIIRFYDPVSGRVTINGQDIRHQDISALRSGMALVTQDPFLFSGSIRENIFPGDVHISEKEVESVLTASNCRAFIERLPKGLDTELSEGGSSVSSGERQLISIARAFARNPQLIILDEATSYIDSETEVKIQEALGNLMQNRTSLIVAHRLSTTRNADRIIVLHRGKIIESGNHEALMARRGFYYKLNLLQR